MLAVAFAIAPVVGGTRVAAGELPDVVLVVAPTSLCTGTLIAPDIVLTAGHCIADDPKLVLVGSVDYASGAGELVHVATATAYPDWRNTYDVGVIELAEPIAGVAPRAIAIGCTLAGGDPLRIAGFGLADPSGSGDNTRLLSAVVTIDDPACVTDPACTAAVAPDGELVAGGDGADACYGDSGGPLLVQTAGGEALIGVVSRSTGETARPCDGAAVYERADAVADWIEDTTDRALARAPCAFDARTPVGGCTTTPGAGLAVGLTVLAVSLRRRRRPA